MSDSFAPVILIEGFLGLGVVLWLYVSHQREMKQIRRAREAAQRNNQSEQNTANKISGSDDDPNAGKRKP
jgi:archaellum component FlaF (FlaF/FlaG flagellin family)